MPNEEQPNAVNCDELLYKDNTPSCELINSLKVIWLYCNLPVGVIQRSSSGHRVGQFFTRCVEESES